MSFHNGIATVEDTKGYFHINKKDIALYESKYQQVENFYNGKVIAIAFSNNKIIISES